MKIHVCRMQIRYPSLVLCSSGSETHEAAGEYSSVAGWRSVGGQAQMYQLFKE